MVFFFLLLELLSFSSSLLLDENLLQIVTCGNTLPPAASDPLLRNGKHNEKDRKGSENLISCPHSHCMDIWTEKMPLSWIDSTNYIYPLPTRRGPLWNIARDIHCLVLTKSPLNFSDSWSCSCHLPLMSSRREYSDFSLTRSLFFGDSTLRNFVNYLRGDLNRVAYISLIRDPPWRVSYLKNEALLFPPEPYQRLENFSQSLFDYEGKMKRLSPPNRGLWHNVTESIKSECLNASVLGEYSVMKYVQEAYEDLDHSHVPYHSHAVENCNAHPDRLLIFVVTGGLHYLTVRPSAPSLCLSVSLSISLSLLTFFLLTSLPSMSSLCLCLCLSLCLFLESVLWSPET
jgi:hypothetical protein